MIKYLGLCIVKNAEQTIEYMVESIYWLDKIILVNDTCTDDTIKIFINACNKFNLKFEILFNTLGDLIKIDSYSRRDVSNELNVRNYFLNYCFNKYSPKSLILIDSDELMSVELKNYIDSIDLQKYDSLAMQCNHLVTFNKQLNIYRQNWNNVEMIDPHIRVLFKEKQYIKGEWDNTPDPFLKYNIDTLCTNLNFHYHLHYFNKIMKKNYSFKFLPELITENIDNKYLINTKSIPKDIRRIINKI